eukprot:5448-Heterococcus_DN1.PRE.5
MAFLMEQAGGLALTGKTRIMDLRPKTPLIDTAVAQQWHRSGTSQYTFKQRQDDYSCIAENSS